MENDLYDQQYNTSQASVDFQWPAIVIPVTHNSSDRLVIISESDIMKFSN